MLPSPRPRWSLPAPSPGDRLLKGAYGFKLECLKFPPGDDDDDDGDCSISFELTGCIDSPAEARELVAAILGKFNSPQGGEGCNV